MFEKKIETNPQSLSSDIRFLEESEVVRDDLPHVVVGGQNETLVEGLVSVIRELDRPKRLHNDRQLATAHTVCNSNITPIINILFNY